MPDDKTILNVQDACSLLRISRNTMYKLLSEGKITAVRCGRRWRISKDSIIAYVNCDKKY